MGKKIEILPEKISSILNDRKELSIRKLANKYQLNKNVILRVLNINNKKNLENIQLVVCKQTNLEFRDVFNKSGVLTKHLKSINIKSNLTDVNEYQKYFHLKFLNKNIISFENFIYSLRLTHTKKCLFGGLTYYYFKKKKRYIFFIELLKIATNDKIKPILFYKLKDRYKNSIFIFEDEWEFKQILLQEKIKLILNISKLTKIYARNCYIQEINNKQKSQFLNNNHIQGSVNSSLAFGAYYNNDLVGVMTFIKYRNMTNSKDVYDYELNRFATNINYHIIGIGGKLFKYFLNTIKINSTILSFGDRRFVLSRKKNLYNTINFNYNGISRHDYSYVKLPSIIRNHKFKMQRIYKKNKLNLTETEYYEKNDYKKIWDCGKYKFTYKYE